MYDLLSEPALLILDEIGVQHGSDTERNIIFEIVNERYEGMKPTILISNLALPSLTEWGRDSAREWFDQRRVEYLRRWLES